MRIETIRIHNFKAFREAEMTDIPPFCVVVGANGSGKSTLFDIFGFLRDCLTFNVSSALQRRGGFREVLSRGANIEKDHIALEIQFRMDIGGVNRLVTYEIHIGQNKTENRSCGGKNCVINVGGMVRPTISLILKMVRVMPSSMKKISARKRKS